MFCIPIVATCNLSTANLNMLADNDFLGNVANRIVVIFSTSSDNNDFLGNVANRIVVNFPPEAT